MLVIASQSFTESSSACGLSWLSCIAVAFDTDLLVRGLRVCVTVAYLSNTNNMIETK
jgi:hypothetical protein